MKEKTTVGTLVVDERLTRIRPINAFFVSRWRQALRWGDDLQSREPIVVEAGTMKVVSGNHRVTALMEEYGPDHELTVTTMRFDSERELLEEFARRNTKHGNPLSGISKASITIELIKLGATKEEIARLLGVSVRSVSEMAGHTVVIIGKKGKSQLRELAPVKRGMQPGIEMTQDQHKEHMRKDRGITVVEQADQLGRWLDNGFVVEDPDNIEALRSLQMSIQRFLSGLDQEATA